MIVKRRIILYIVSFFLLLGVASFTILVSKGYIFDFKNRSFKKSGIILIRSIPKNVNIYLNNTFKKNKTPLNISVFPERYNIRIESPNHITWEKNVLVKSGVVTWLEYIFLIPKERPINSLTTEGIKSYKFSPNKTRVAFVDLKNNIWTANIKTNEHKKLYSSINEQEVYILDWSKNSKNILLHTIRDGHSYFKIISEDNTVELKSPPGSIMKAELRQDNSDYAYILANNNLYLTSQNEMIILQDNINTFSQNSDQIYYAKSINEKSEIWQASFNLERRDKLYTENFTTTTIFPSEKNRIAYIAGKDNELFYIDNGKRNKVAEKVVNVEWTKDAKQFHYRTYSELSIYTFESNNPDEPEKRTTTRLSENITESHWFFDYKHIVFKCGDEINIIDYDGSNLVRIANNASTNIFETTRLGKNLIFAEEKDGIKNIKIMNLVIEN